MLSRFRSPGEQRKVLQAIARRRRRHCHRHASPHFRRRLVFKDLGLVVIDEEQRFGVLHKEKFKELFKLVDVLTLSATPIPRTLYLSLVGVKDMSTIETPPLNRLPVETVVCGYDERIIRDAINRELERQGQVFFLHNRVQSIEKMRDRIADLLPECAGGYWPRPNGCGRIGGGDAALRRRKNRRAGLHHDYRERPRYSKRQYHYH